MKKNMSPSDNFTIRNLRCNQFRVLSLWYQCNYFFLRMISSRCFILIIHMELIFVLYSYGIKIIKKIVIREFVCTAIQMS